MVAALERTDAFLFDLRLELLDARERRFLLSGGGREAQVATGSARELEARVSPAAFEAASMMLCARCGRAALNVEGLLGTQAGSFLFGVIGRIVVVFAIAIGRAT